MAIRIKEVIGKPIPGLKPNISFEVLELGSGQRIIAFKPRGGIAGYVHSGPPRKDFKQITEIHKGVESTIKMVKPRGTTIIVEGY